MYVIVDEDPHSYLYSLFVAGSVRARASSSMLEFAAKAGCGGSVGGG